jgi:hypothetical protein
VLLLIFEGAFKKIAESFENSFVAPNGLVLSHSINSIFPKRALLVIIHDCRDWMIINYYRTGSIIYVAAGVPADRSPIAAPPGFCSYHRDLSADIDNGIMAIDGDSL